MLPPELTLAQPLVSHLQKRLWTSATPARCWRTTWQRCSWSLATRCWRCERSSG